MLLNGDVDFSAVFTVTSYANLLGSAGSAQGLSLVLLFGLRDRSLSTGVMVSKKLRAEKPKAVAGLVKALNKAMIEVAGNPEAAGGKT